MQRDLIRNLRSASIILILVQDHPLKLPPSNMEHRDTLLRESFIGSSAKWGFTKCGLTIPYLLDPKT
eukprot:2208135-Heterocapsa_arctica.AAC.1